MSSLNDLVLEIVRDWVSTGELFTALDVSNKVKETAPFARHREVRDIVRSLFQTEMETNGYSRTPISVTLADGSSADALLYHSLIDSWDLDNKYASSRRAAATVVKSNTVPVGTSVPAPVVAAPAPVVTTTPVVTPVAPPAALSPLQKWQSLFDTNPSLFPRK